MRRGASRTARYDTGQDRTGQDLRDGTERDGTRMQAAFREQCGVKCLTLTGRNHRTADADPHAAYVTLPVPRCCSGVIARGDLWMWPGSLYVIIPTFVPSRVASLSLSLSVGLCKCRVNTAAVPFGLVVRRPPSRIRYIGDGT